MKKKKGRSRLSIRCQREDGGRVETWAKLRKLAASTDINLGQGFPDFVVVPEAVDAARESLLGNDHNQYAAMSGSSELRAALSEMYGPRAPRRNEDDVENENQEQPAPPPSSSSSSSSSPSSWSNLDPESEICVCTSGTEALYAAMQGLVDPGDVVVLFEPLFPWYEPCLRLAGGTAVCITLQAPDFSILQEKTRRELEEVFAKNSPRVCIFNTPHNPTGHCATAEELQFLADVNWRVYVCACLCLCVCVSVCVCVCV